MTDWLTDYSSFSHSFASCIMLNGNRFTDRQTDRQTYNTHANEEREELKDDKDSFLSVCMYARVYVYVCLPHWDQWNIFKSKSKSWSQSKSKSVIDPQL